MKKTSNVIINKNNFQFIKSDHNKFQLVFEISNNNIFIPKIINFDLIDLIYKLNPNIFDAIYLEKVNNNEIKINSLLKDLFCELGLPQYYSSLKVIKRETDNNKYIIFDCFANNSKYHDFPDDTESVPLENVAVYFEIITNHKINVICDITLTEDHGLPPFSEKIIGNLIYNIFNKVKQFIENISFNT